MTGNDTLQGGAGPGAADQKCEEVSLVLSDLHLGEGKTVRISPHHGLIARAARRLRGERRAHVGDLIEVPNPLEDFPHDAAFADFIALMSERFADADVLRLRLMGDVFDPLAVSMRGRFVDPPYEAVGLYKMRKIVRGHPAFFDALSRFVRLPNARIDIFAGNHDLFVVWPKVQLAIIERICGGDPTLEAKVRFFDHHRKFEDLHREVLYYHGMNAEPHNTCDPANVILTKRFTTKLKRPVLNMPYGSYMTVGLVNRLKLRNKLVGRMREDRLVWTHAVRFRWGWGVYAALVLLWHFIYSHLFAFWDFRRKSSIKRTIATVVSTAVKNPVDKYAAKLLKDRQGVRVVVLGHSHNWRRISSENGTYLNSGSWAQTYRLEDPKFVLRWKRFGRLETAWRVAGHFLKTGELQFFAQLRKVITYLAVVTAMVAFLVVSLPHDPAHSLAGITPEDLKLPVAILLGFIVVGGFFRFFAARPTVVDGTKFTFGMIRHFGNGDLKAEVMEYVPEDRSIKECV